MGGGGSNPIFGHGKMCVFPFFPMEKNGEKSIWKEREMNTFPFLSIYFFPIFPMGKNGKTHIFPWAKMGLDPPRPPINQNLLFSKESYGSYRKPCKYHASLNCVWNLVRMQLFATITVCPSSNRVVITVA